ncbi:MAG: hypothetical protein K8I30_15315 [Anaerolineae bacterium]|nr:hypothetical protein [Anaerolineae bacterium]
MSEVIAPEDVEKFDPVTEVWQEDYGPPTWSPDGSHIAFARIIRGTEDHPLARFDVFVMDAVGTNLVDPTPDEDDNGYSLSWSPDSQKLAFACEAEESLCIVDGDGGNLQRLETVPNTHIRDIAWSPDGKQIALSLSNKDFYGAELYLVNADGSNLHRLLDAESNHQYHSQPVWSPDGSKIAFRSDEPPNGSGEIYVIEPNNANIFDLSRTLNGNEFGAAWSPDSNQVAFFSSQYPEGLYLYIAQADGSHLEQITDNHTWDIDDAGSPEVFWIP